MRLHTRIYLHFLALLIVVGLVASAIALTGARGAYMRDLVGRIAKHSSTLMGEHLGTTPALQQRMQQLARDFDVDVTLRGLDGELLQAVGKALPAVDTGSLATLRQGRVVQKRLQRRVASVLLSDPQTGQATGIVSVALRQKVPWDWFYRPLVFVLAALALAAVGTRPLARRIAQPLERLTSAARRFGDGDLRYRLPIESQHNLPPAQIPDELTQLTHAFNDMAERLAVMVRAEKELLANVSHELRTPLQRLQAAMQAAPGAAEADRWAADVKDDVDALESALNAVLTSGRMEASGLRSHIQPLDLRNLLQSVARRAPHIPGRQTAVPEVNVATTVPAMVEGDPALLQRALNSLLDNAAHYGAPPVTLGADMQGNLLTISVTDSGPGIPPEQREHVMEPFARLHEQLRPDAHGIGLTLAQRIAVAHGGTLRIVDSVKGTGCRVELSIPLDPPP